MLRNEPSWVHSFHNISNQYESLIYHTRKDNFINFDSIHLIFVKRGLRCLQSPYAFISTNYELFCICRMHIYGKSIFRSIHRGTLTRKSPTTEHCVCWWKNYQIRVNHPHPRRTTLANLLIIFVQCKLVCYIDVNDYEVWISKWQLQENEFWCYFFKYNDLVYASNIPLK